MAKLFKVLSELRQVRGRQIYFPHYGTMQVAKHNTNASGCPWKKNRIRRVLFDYLINCNVEIQHQTTIQPKSILASVRFNVCVMLFSMN